MTLSVFYLLYCIFTVLHFTSFFKLASYVKDKKAREFFALKVCVLFFKYCNISENLSNRV